jgi:transcriptional regulatory protein GAL4
MPRAERANWPKSRSFVRACTECQRRKSKCSGTSPCAFCSKTSRKCIFDAPPERTSLTRRNLDEAQARCKRLEALLTKLHPDVDIASLLGGDELAQAESGPPESSPNVDGKEPSGNITPLTEYEWHESPPSNKHDTSQQGDGDEGAGMGLESKPFKSGYLGSGSGSSLLEAISALLPFANAKEYSQSPTKTALQTSPSLWRPPAGSSLAAEANIASIALTTRLVDAYFVFYNTSYPVLHKRQFQASYENRDSIPARSSWHLIFYIVLAIGNWVLSSGDESDNSLYYSAARSRLSMRMLESGTLGGVQAFLLMGNYLQKRDRPNTGYNLIGIAYRMALGLGIHRELPARVSRNDTLSTERRRQVWWVLYCFDSGFSITTGRPCTASDGFIDTRLPRNIDDMVFPDRNCF